MTIGYALKEVTIFLTFGYKHIRGEPVFLKMVTYNKYDNVEWNFSWCQSFGNPKFK
jgi:hypothetical protein